ncbi:MAG: PAS domain S-box protein [Acidobacteriota bacterium]
MNHETPEEIHLALLQALPDGMCFTDLRGTVRFWSGAAEQITGFSVAEAVCAQHPEDVFFLSDPDGQATRHIETGIDTPGNYFLRHKDGHSVPVLVRRLPVSRLNGEPMGLLHLFTLPAGSIARTEAQREGMANLLEQHESRRGGVLIIQIDAFEDIVKRFGPEASEKVRDLVDRTTAVCLKDGDASRELKDGVFLASVATASLSSLQDVADRIRLLIQSARMRWWGEPVKVTVSVGGTLIHPRDAPADALRRAEERSLVAREAGGNQVVLE